MSAHADAIAAELAALSEVGRSRRPPRGFDIEDALRGISRDGGKYAMEVLLGGYLDARRRVGFGVGDTVRVRRPWAETLAHNGWSGYAAMFHDADAEVVEVLFSPHHGAWHVDIRYPDPYYYSAALGSGGEHRLYVQDGPAIFMMWPQHLKRIKRAAS